MRELRKPTGRWQANGTIWLTAPRSKDGLHLGKNGGPLDCSQGTDCIPVLVRGRNASMGHQASPLELLGRGPQSENSP